MGYKLREIRTNKGINQETLSQLSGVSRQTISDIESGDTKVNTTVGTLQKLAEALQCKVTDIFSS